MGGSIDFAKYLLGGKRGLAIDNDPQKVNIMRREGYECVLGDVIRIDLPADSVRFVVMIHLLEHLPDRESIEKSIKSAAKVATDFIYIRGPYFDADEYLESKGLKFFWSDWTGHPYHLKTDELRSTLDDLGLNNYKIVKFNEVLDSSHPAVHPINSPKNQHRYKWRKHPAKPFVKFKEKLYTEFICYVQLRPFENWENIIQSHKRKPLMWILKTYYRKIFLEEESLWEKIIYFFFKT
ncbi:MAG: hypothetical protein ACE5JK_01720 [Candidatus Omnitrophota bacterium]